MTEPRLTAVACQVYAVVVGALSALTCVVYFVPPVLRHAGIVAVAWNFVLFILWIAVFGVFASVRDGPFHMKYCTQSGA